MINGLTKKLLIPLVAITASVAVISAAGWAYWSATGTGTGSATVGTLNPPTNIGLEIDGGTVLVIWDASATAPGATPDGYYVERQRLSAAVMTWDSACGTSATSLITSQLQCTDTVSNSGDYRYRVVAQLGAGSWTAISTATDFVHITLDGLSPTTGASLAPPPNSAGWGNTPAVTVTLTAVDNSSGSGVKDITYWSQGAHEIGTTVFSGPTTSFEVSAEGTTTVSYFASDNAANIEPPKTIEVKIDRTAPAMPTIDTKPVLVTRQTAATFSFSGGGSDVVAYRCQLDSGAIGACNTGTTTYPGPLGDGQHTFRVWAVDRADNLSATPATYAWTVDSASPSVTVVNSAHPDGSYKAGQVIPITVTFSESVTVTGVPQLGLNSGGTASYTGGSGSNSLSFTYTVAAGHNASDLDYASTSALTLNGGTIQDAAGNSALLSLPAMGSKDSLGSSKAIVVDTTPPAVTVTKVNGSVRSFPYSTATNVTSIGGTCGQSSGDQGTVAVTINGAAAVPATSPCSAGGWTLTLTTALDAESTYSIVATQTDSVGNPGKATQTVTIDKTAPTIAITNFVATGQGQAVRITGSASQGTGDSSAVVVVLCKNETFPCAEANVAARLIANVDAAGNWSVTSGNLGNKTVVWARAEQVDEAGNTARSNLAGPVTA